MARNNSGVPSNGTAPTPLQFGCDGCVSHQHGVNGGQPGVGGFGGFILINFVKNFPV